MASTAELEPMKITIAGITFDHHHYDERGDVLYLNVGAPRREASGVETPEGHGLHYDEQGVVIGITLMNVRWTLEREGELTVTWPEQHLPADALDPVLSAA
jgi:uncharacterized protein YuzE